MKLLQLRYIVIYLLAVLALSYFIVQTHAPRAAVAPAPTLACGGLLLPGCF